MIKPHTFLLKNMTCGCCIRVVRQELINAGIEVKDVKLGKVDFEYDDGNTSLDDLVILLEESGFEVITDREDKLVEQIKQVVIDLVHYSTYNSMVRNSDFLVERFNMSYQHLSSIFSRHEKITLEKFIILHKIEKVKELIQSSDLTLSEIAFMMGYSTVQYLSTQFKNITGVSVSDFKKDPTRFRKPLESLH